MRPEVPVKAVDTHRDGDISQSLEMRKKRRRRRRWKRKRKDPSLVGGSVLWLRRKTSLHCRLQLQDPRGQVGPLAVLGRRRPE